MKRAFVALLVLAVSPSASAWDVPKPSAQIRSFQVQSLSLRDVTFLVELSVKNPYPVALPIDAMSFDFSVEGAKVFSTASKGAFSVKALGERTNAFTVVLTYDSVIKAVKDYASKEWLNTVIDSVLVIKLPQMPGLPSSIRFPFKLQRKIPAIKPSVSLLDFQVVPPTTEQVAAALAKTAKAVDPGTALGVFRDVLSGKPPSTKVVDPAELDVPLTVSFKVEIRNDARAALGFDKLGYQLFVNDDALVKGETTSVQRDGTRTLVEVASVFSSKRLSKNVKALFTARRGTFRVAGNASIKLPDEIARAPIPLAFSEAGVFALH